MIIAVDFDGTCVTHEFPKVGKDIGAVDVLRDLVAAGHKIILYTMRSEGQVKFPGILLQAISWFKENNIPLYGVNTNPGQRFWTESPKCYAELYIDDMALGVPLVYPEEGNPYVDWVKVRVLLEERQMFTILEETKS